MEETIDLQKLIKIMRKRIIFILSVSVFTVIIVGVISYYFLTPVYQASTQILINQQKSNVGQFNAQDIQTNLQLINTYNVIIKSPAILSRVIEDLDLNTTPDLLEKRISVNSAQDSQIVNISVKDLELDKAVGIANTTANIFQEEIRTLMNVDNVSILSPAVQGKNQSPEEPNPKRNMAIAAIIGMMLGAGITFLLEYLDMTIKTEQDIEDLLGLPILGIISPITEKELNSRDDSKKRSRKRR